MNAAHGWLPIVESERGKTNEVGTPIERKHPQEVEEKKVHGPNSSFRTGFCISPHPLYHNSSPQTRRTRREGERREVETNRTGRRIVSNH